jgi:hypothetical protein
VDGFFVALELKRKKMKASKLQEFYLKRVTDSGGVALVAYPENWEEVKEVLMKFANRRD